MDDTSYLTVGGQTSVDKTFSTFRANSIIVNNLTNQWVLINGTDQVQPYVLRAIIPVNGASRLQAKFSAPVGIPATATIAGQQAIIVADEMSYPPSPGVQVPIRSPSSERRNPLAIIFFDGRSINANNGTTTTWTYQVPTGRRFVIETAQSISYVRTVYADTSGFIETAVAFFPLDAASGPFICDSLLDVSVANVIGTRADALIGSTKELQATDRVSGIAKDTNLAGAGSCYHVSIMSGTEFDA